MGSKGASVRAIAEEDPVELMISSRDRSQLGAASAGNASLTYPLEARSSFSGFPLQLHLLLS